MRTFFFFFLFFFLPFCQLASHHTCLYTFDSRFHLPDHLLLVVLLLVLVRRELRDEEVLLRLLRKGLLRHRPHM